MVRGVCGAGVGGAAVRAHLLTATDKFCSSE